MMRCRNEGFEIKWQRQSVRYIAEKSKNHIWRKLHSSRTHVRLGAWFWSAQADIFFSESLHSTLRSGRRKTIVSQTMCALAEHLSQSEIELPLRNTCYYSPLAEVGVSTQTEIKNNSKRIIVKFSLWPLHPARPRECVWTRWFCGWVRGSGRK